MEGLVTSVGGMSESVVKHSSNAFVAWAKEQLKLERYRTLQLVRLCGNTQLVLAADEPLPTGCQCPPQAPACTVRE